MRKILTSTMLLMLLLIGCVSEKPTNEFTISIKCEGISEGIAKIYSAPPANALIDSVSFSDGQFVFKGTIDTPDISYVYIEDTEGKMVSMFTIFLEADDLKINCNTSSINNIDYEYAPITVVVNDYNAYIKSLPERSELYEISKEASALIMEGESEKAAEFEGRREELTKSLLDKVMSYKDNASKSHALAFVVYTYATSLPIEEREKIVSQFDENFNSIYLQKIKDSIEREKGVAYGSMAPDFELKDLDGNTYTLESFRGKNVYIVFSATWCGWCKKEVPFIRDAYEALKDQGNIEFVTICMDDKRELWEREVEEDNIEWYCLSNLEGMGSDLAKSYNVTALPDSYVINTKGEIIRRDLRGKETLTFLSALDK